MNDAPALFLSAIAGSLLGALFFGGLWWTVKRVASSRSPGLLFVGSQLLRTSVVVSGFYVVSGGHPARLFACLGGFVVASIGAKIMGRAPGGRVPASEAGPGDAP